MGMFKEFRDINLDQLVISDHQVRTRDVERELDELVSNLRVHGQLEPIVVSPLDTTGERYEIVAGQRRYLAAKRLGWSTVTAAIFEHHIDATTARVLSVSENLVRRDLTSKDLIDACTELNRKYGSVKAVAEELGLPYNRVRAYVKFDRLRPHLKHMVQAGDITLQTALRIEDHYADQQVDSAELTRTAQTVAGMTNAQQADFFRETNITTTRQPGPPTRRNLSTTNPTDSTRPGTVRQIVVTLSEEAHIRLRRWAKDNGMGQDTAARGIITRFLQSTCDEARKRNGSEPTQR